MKSWPVGTLLPHLCVCSPLPARRRVGPCTLEESTIYGVMAQAVGQRLHEFGVRQALGARPADILRLVVSSGAALGFAGLVMGAGIALAVTRLIASLLYRVDPADPGTFAAVAVVLFSVAAAASYFPARRGSIPRRRCGTRKSRLRRSPRRCVRRDHDDGLFQAARLGRSNRRFAPLRPVGWLFHRRRLATRGGAGETSG